MRKAIVLTAAAALAALALFLPEQLSGLQDRQLLDSPSIQIHSEGQEGFAESLQLSLGEKLMLLRGGSMTVMELNRGWEETAYVILPDPDGAEAEFSVNIFDTSAGPKASTGSDMVSYAEDRSQLWQARMEELQNELRGLQAAGGLPELWSDESRLQCSGREDLLYIDPDTKMNFQVYHAFLESDFYTMDLTVDVQSGRILHFRLRWGKDMTPSWGMRGAYNFGEVWRNYWGLDSVDSGWYGEYGKSILEQAGESNLINGDYGAHGQIAFTYDGQTLLVPLDCEAYNGRSFSISWNN